MGGETLQHAVDHAKSKSWDLLNGVDKNQLARFSSTLRKAIENMEGQICASTQLVEIQNFLDRFSKYNTSTSASAAIALTQLRLLQRATVRKVIASSGAASVSDSWSQGNIVSLEDIRHTLTLIEAKYKRVACRISHRIVVKAVI